MEINMKRLFAVAVVAASSILVNPVGAQTSQAGQTAQQNKMTVCNKEAAGLKGDERKAFMKDCLSNKPAKSAAQQAQQDKMKMCNEQAKGKTGDERKAFMSQCLKK